MKSLVLLLLGFSVSVVAQQTASTDLSKSRVFAADEGATRTLPNGGTFRDVLRGALLSGEAVSVHESMQPAGAAPAPLHVIDHSEFILVREGTVSFVHDGVTEAAGPGAMLYVAKGTNHAVRNGGSVPATYVVIAFGGDAAGPVRK